MLDPDLEVGRLRWRLQDRGYSYADIDNICRAASEDITNSILDIVSSASAEAVSYAEGIGATDFFADVDVVPDGFAFSIRTRSGRTDYSVDRREMLGEILKTGKTAADGSKYQHVPIKDKKMGTSSMDSMRERDRATQVARQALKDKAAGNISERAQAMANQFRQSMVNSIAAKKQETGETHFRTASSKHDASSQWVIPEINRDMTQYLHELNQNIKDSIDNSILNTIARYDQEYT